ncbi:MAG: methionyl-tRNA formyltransferase [SAR202 cluster bacterium]|nr:methionyl-tRNA formyltransferase [SAR202 cluster bacterium]
MRLVFMGTPSFVVPVLERLNTGPSLEIAGVYTPPDRPRGRGQSPEMPPVKARALELGLPMFQPPTLRSARAQAELGALQPDVIVVAAYGLLLPPAVLDTPAHGCLNLHPSLLPKYRGPSPVVTAILEGDSVTGATLMLLDEGMDTGPILAQREHPIGPEDTAQTLTASLFALGADLLLENLPLWTSGQLTPRPQDSSQATITRKVEREDGLARWELSAGHLDRLRRAYTPWPGLYTMWQGKVLKLLDVAALPNVSAAGAPGLVVTLDSKEWPLGVVTAQGILGLKTVQLEGRRPASTADFLRGYPQFAGAAL